MAASKLRVALFECERLQEHLAPKVYERTGGYLTLLQNAFQHFSRRSPASLPSVELIGFDTKAEQYPADVNDFDGVLISGSLSGVYDDDPWISRLLQEIKFLDQRRVKTCGISFGHQAIAKALGGEIQKNPKVDLLLCPTSGKSSFVEFSVVCFPPALHLCCPNPVRLTIDQLGSEVSVRSATLTERAQKLFGTDRTDFRLQYHHNDAILQLPRDLEVLAFNNVTQYQSLFKPSHFLTFCGHPDYSHNPEVLEQLLEYDREKLWVHEQLIEYGLATLHQPTDYEWVLRQIVRFYSGKLDVGSSVDAV